MPSNHTHRAHKNGHLFIYTSQATAGQGQVVALVGEAGVGKSRLVYEVIHSHRTQGWRVLESASVSYGKATPYFPVIELLKRYAHVEQHDDTRTVRAKVTGQVLTLDTPSRTPSRRCCRSSMPCRRTTRFARSTHPSGASARSTASSGCCCAKVRSNPLLLVCEDLHWIDTETQALLDSLVESLPTARLLLLVNYRPEYQHGWGSKTFYTQLRLDPLPPASAEALLQALLGEDASLLPLTQRLIARTQGNPFFLEESVRTLVETGVLVGARGAYRLAQAVPSLQVPATVQALLAARIDRLPPEDKRLLQTAAVIGTEVPWRCCRPLPMCLTRPCTVAWRISRPPSSSTRPVCFRSAPTPSSTPSRTRWPMGVCCRSGGGRCTRALSRPSNARWRPGGRAGRTPGAPCPAG